MIPDALRDQLADQILEEIKVMQAEGYYLGTVHHRLPKIDTFSALHDHMDANEWGPDFDDACAQYGFSSVATAVFPIVDERLRME